MWASWTILFYYVGATFASSFGHVSRIGSEKIMFNINEMELIFQEYLSTFDKSYDEETYNYRLQIFREKIVEINELNKNSESTTFGINFFTDLTKIEYKNYYGLKNVDDAVHSSEHFFGYVEVPSSLDWRLRSKVTSAKNQGPCSASWVYSATGNMESQYAIKHNQLISLSEQQVLDCETRGAGCHGGQPNYVFQYVQEIGGIQSEDDYPHKSINQDCSFNISKVKVKVTSFKNIIVNNEDALKEPLSTYGPLSIVININDNIQAYTNGVYNDNCLSDAGAKHAVLLVGYGTENNESYWIIKNSWGIEWGEKGYIRFKMGANTCGIGDLVATTFVQ